MKIKSIEVRTLDLDAQYGRYRAQLGVLMAHTEGGPTGISRCLATARSAIEDRLAPMLVGQDPLETERLWRAMYGSIGNLDSDRRETVTAIGSLDIALWDLKGKILGAPVHRLLGGYRDDIPAYADGAMFHRGPDGMAEWAARYVNEGFRAVKYHVMEEGPDEVVETVRRTRHAVGTDVQIMVDVHKSVASAARRPDGAAYGAVRRDLAGGAGDVGRRGRRHEVSNRRDHYRRGGRGKRDQPVSLP